MMPLLRRLWQEHAPETAAEHAQIEEVIAEASDAVERAKAVIDKHTTPCNGRCPKRRRNPADSLIRARDRLGPP